MNTLARIDIDTGDTNTWWCGSRSSLQEPCFIPRAGSSAEGDGYLRENFYITCSGMAWEPAR